MQNMIVAFNNTKEKLKTLFEKPEIIFAFIALVFGLLFCFLTPPFETPDENGHFWKTCEVATGHFFLKTPIQRTVYETKSKDILPMQRPEDSVNWISGYSPVMYFLPAIAVKSTSSITDNPNIIFYSGRMANLFLYILLISLAIKITPVFKYPLLYAGLFPMALWITASYSADSFTIALSFLFFAYLFKVIFGQKETTNKDLVIIFILALLGAAAKAIVYPLVLLFFLPAFSGKRPILKRIIYIISTLAAAFVLCYILRVNNYVFYNPYVTNSPPHGYFWQHPVEVTGKIIYSTYKMLSTYILMLVGAFGWLKLKFFSHAFTNTFLGIFLGLIFVQGVKINKKLRLTSISIFICAHIAIMLMYFYIWTDLEDSIIKGVQGRYYLPMLPLWFLILSNNLIKLPENVKCIIKLLVTAFLFITLSYVAYRLYDTYFIQHYSFFKS